MLQVAQHLSISDFSTFASTNGHAIESESQRIRFAAADLFRQGRVAEADLLTHEAMQQYPDSEDVLVMRALICEVRQDWNAAAQALEQLLKIQGRNAPVESWCHCLRVLRCDGQLHQAFDIALQAKQHHPAHPAIASELAQLEAMGVNTSRQTA